MKVFTKYQIYVKLFTIALMLMFGLHVAVPAAQAAPPAPADNETAVQVEQPAKQPLAVGDNPIEIPPGAVSLTCQKTPCKIWHLWTTGHNEVNMGVSTYGYTRVVAECWWLPNYMNNAFGCTWDNWGTSDYAQANLKTPPAAAEKNLTDGIEPKMQQTVSLSCDDQNNGCLVWRFDWSSYEWRHQTLYAASGIPTRGHWTVNYRGLAYSAYRSDGWSASYSAY